MRLTILTRQLEHRYASLVRSLVAGVDGSMAARQLGSRPTIQWHATHIADAIEVSARAVLGRPLGIPGPARAATYREMVQIVEQRTHAMLAGLRSLDEATLDLAPAIEVHPAFRETLTSRFDFLDGHVYHVAYHVGSVAVLRAEFTADTTG